MNNLSYDDVKRATQDAIRNLQEVVGELRSSHDDIRRNMQQLDNVTFRLNSMQSQLNLMQQQLHDQTNSIRPAQGHAQSLQALQNQHNDMQRRMVLLEQLLRSCLQQISNLNR